MSLPGEQSGPTGERQLIRALVDTNVVLDWLLDRKPWSDAAQPLWDARDAGRVVAYLPASVLTDIFYIIRRQEDSQRHLLRWIGSLPLSAYLLWMRHCSNKRVRSRAPTLKIMCRSPAR